MTVDDVNEPVRDAAAEDAYPTYVVCTVVTCTVDLPETFARVTLAETAFPFRTCVVPVGLPDAAAIVAAVSGPAAPRPSSQDLLATILQRTNVDVVAARITGAEAGIFTAELDLMGQKGRMVVPCRPTDAINAALRHPGGAPIVVDEVLLDRGALA
jgi:bifunctional DNase/RNase